MTFKDYVALTKPKIIPMLLLVALASSVMASRGLPPYVALFGLLVAGTLTSAGSLAINSYLEVDIDMKMERTRKRPLPSMRIKPASRALVFGVALVTLGVLTSLLFLTLFTTFFILLGSIIYLLVYTIWLKPRTKWNIILGGSAGSCAALAGWYAITPTNALVAWILAALVFVWTPSHFWSLAMITDEDYTSAGIPMLPAVVGRKTAAEVIVLSTLLLIPVSFLFYPYLAGTGEIVYLVGVFIIDSLLIATNIKILLSPTKSNAWLAFKFSSPYLAIVFVLGCISVLI